MFKKLMCFAAIGLIILDTVGEPLSVLAAEGIGDDLVNSITIEDWYDENGELQYPLTMDDERWHGLHSEENMCKVCQIPDEILQSLSTEELLYMVEQYPNFTVLAWYQYTQEGFLTMRETFNGLEELMQREDCKDIVLREYEELSVSEQSRYDYDANIHDETAAEDLNRIIKDQEAMRLVRQDSQEIYIACLLEMILAQDEIQAQFEPDDTRRLGDALMEKTELKAQSECFEFRASNCYTPIAGTDNDTVKYIYMKELDEIKEQAIISRQGNEAGLFTSIKPPVSAVPIILYTRGGNRILCQRAKEAEATESDYATLVGRYEECTIVERLKYNSNCHAYAWLSLDSRNRSYRKKVILLDTNLFSTDPAYKQYSEPRAGMVVVWSQHSGVVEQVDYTYWSNGVPITEPLVSSVWMNSIVVLHPISQGTNGTPNFYK